MCLQKISFHFTGFISILSATQLGEICNYEFNQALYEYSKAILDDHRHIISCCIAKVERNSNQDSELLNSIKIISKTIECVYQNYIKVNKNLLKILSKTNTEINDALMKKLDKAFNECTLAFQLMKKVINAGGKLIVLIKSI